MAAQVLVVEDDPDIREAVVGLLQAETPWLEVSSASDGLEALELLEEGAAPCLALLDVMMPVMNGIEFLDALRERHLAPEMHVVLVSAHVRIAKHVHYPGVTGLLPKPFGPEELLEIVRRHCPAPGADIREH
jgi:CheY-like chemotaxis protein